MIRAQEQDHCLPPGLCNFKLQRFFWVPLLILYIIQFWKVTTIYTIFSESNSMFQTSNCLTMVWCCYSSWMSACCWYVLFNTLKSCCHLLLAHNEVERCMEIWPKLHYKAHQFWIGHSTAVVQYPRIFCISAGCKWELRFSLFKPLWEQINLIYWDKSNWQQRT